MKRLLAVVMLLAIPDLARAQQAEVVEYYAQDAIGSIRVVFNSSGVALARQDYAPFGRPLFAAAAIPREGFTAQSKDDEIDQSYFHERTFQPHVGRFNRPDPFPSGVMDPQLWNRYAYVANRPLNLVDPLGLVAEAPTFTGTSNPGCDIDWMDPDCRAGMSNWLDEQSGGGGLGAGFGSGFGHEGFGYADDGSGGGGSGVTAADQQTTPTTSPDFLGEARDCTVENGCMKIGVVPLTPGQIGAAGEAIVKGFEKIGEKGLFRVAGRTRIADGLVPGISITEIKNVAYQALTQQLKDYVAYASDRGMTFVLWVRDGTELSGPLQAARAAGQVVIKTFQWPW